MARLRIGQKEANLFLISFLILFLELAFIRWFPAYVIHLTFFTNFVLIPSFVGMSIGCLASRRPGNLLSYAPLLILISFACALGVFYLYRRNWLPPVVAGGGKEAQVVYFGTEVRTRQIPMIVISV